jgi:hypothetical protein
LHVCEQLSSSRNFLKSESISASQCVVIKQKREKDVSAITISNNIGTIDSSWSIKMTLLSPGNY